MSDLISQKATAALPTMDQYKASLNALPPDNPVTKTIQTNYDPARYQARQAALTPAKPADMSWQDKLHNTIGRLIGAPQTPPANLGEAISGATDQFKKTIEPAGAYMAGAGQTLPGSKLIQQQLPQKWQDAINQIMAKHPTATTLGKVGGTGAQLVAPGMDIVKGVTTAGKVGAMAANAGLNMLPYAVGSGLNTLASGGNVGDAAKAAGASEILGVGAGTALGGAGLLFGKLAKAAHPILNEVDAASYGLVGKDISKPGAEYAHKMGLNPTGYKAATGDSQLDKVLGVLREQGGRGIAGVKKAAGWFQDQFSQINQLFKASGAKLADKMPDIMASPIVQTMQSKFAPEEVQATINSLIADADKRVAAGPKGWSDAINFLNKQMERGIQIGKKAEGGNLAEVTQHADMGELLQDSASVVKAHLKELTGNVLKQTPGAPDMEAIDQIYSAYPSLQSEISRRGGKPMASMGGGSETTAGVGALGAIASGNPAAAALKVAGATALAPLAKRAIGAATNQVMGRSAQGIDTLLQALSKANTPGLAGKTAQLVGMGTNAATASQVPDSPDTPVASTGEAPSQTVSSIAKSEQATPPQGQQAAKDQTNTAWSDQIKQRLGAIYDSMIAPQYSDLMSRDQFFQTAQQMTNNWDPHLTAGFVFQDRSQALAYLKSYDTALKLQGVNMDQALGAAGGVNPLLHPGAAAIANPLIGAATGRNPQTEQSAMALENLKNIIVQHATPYGGKPDASLVNQVSKMIDGIAAMRVSPAKKKQILRDELQQYGVDYAQLAKYGVGQAINSPQAANA